MSQPDVIVVGGGLAGLTAAKTLVDAGLSVDLYEKRSILGGKVSAWKDADDDWIETGLHVFFGAYEEIFVLMRELGIYDRVLWKEHVLTYTLNDGERFEFRTIPLPSPLHLLPAVFQNHYFNLREKLTLIKSLYPMLFGSDRYFAEQDRVSYQDWHRRQGIADRLLSKMFLPMSLALKFVGPEDISARVVLDVAGIFLRENGASRMGFLKGSPQEHLVGPLADYLTHNGARLHTGQGVKRVLLNEDDSIAGLELGDGDIVRAAQYVFALPIHKLNQLVPDRWREKYPVFAHLKQFEGVPVITVQLWLDRQVSGIDNILFCPDGVIPVYADLGNTTPDYAVGGRSRFQFCVAPARDLIKQTDEQIVARVWGDVQRMFPDSARDANVVKATVVRVPQSVYWPKPGMDHLRPTQATPIRNLFLAGGYTQQRFYDSMEGAVSSGRRAARTLLASQAVGQEGGSRKKEGEEGISPLPVSSFLLPSLPASSPVRR
jgi:15-cis-phytoene desaturase